MKKTYLIFTILGLAIITSIPVSGQTDTAITPGNTNTFQDPKVNDHSKILLDTTTGLVDSLLDPKKSGRNKKPQNNTDPLGTSGKPQKVKRSPADSTHISKP